MGSSTALINILIQGLFFLEHKQDMDGKDLLLISAPELAGHHFMGGVRGNLVQLDRWDIDWTAAGLSGGSPKAPAPHSKIPSDIPPTVCQFEREITGTGDIVGSTNGTLRLPWPLRFFPLRLGAIPTYNDSNVAKDIKAHCYHNGNNQLGVVTVLQYELLWPLPTLRTWTPTSNFHFYFQPPEGHTIDDVNKDLKSAANIFQNPLSFDVQLDSSTPNPGSIVVPIGASAFSLGLGPEDELALNEKITLIDSPKELKELLDELNLKKMSPKPNSERSTGGSDDQHPHKEIYFS
ncbi:MAG TPA: hypothetical protein VGK24_05020, partial [Candidatus Angelobacter sp.]